MKGFFIAIEGIDGAGLSTQARLLYENLLALGYRVVLTKEPTDGLIGGLIKAALRGEWKTDPITLQLLFAADRGHHVNQQILPALREGKIVITDRYKYSSIAYGSLDCDEEWLVKINSLFPKPHALIVLDVSVGIALQRIRKTRFGFELFENNRLEIVRQNFIKLAKSENGFVINAESSVKQVQEEILNIILQLMRNT